VLTLCFSTQRQPFLFVQNLIIILYTTINPARVEKISGCYALQAVNNIRKCCVKTILESCQKM